ncbi:MAG: hypothetical protein H6682_02050 [Candidatus Eisenbacteria bacterium]|nr:hypothetical protein [Candidatus Eisenbacteria bacterium]
MRAQSLTWTLVWASLVASLPLANATSRDAFADPVPLDTIEADGPLSDRTLRRLYGTPDRGDLDAALSRIGAALVREGHLEATITLHVPELGQTDLGETGAVTDASAGETKSETHAASGTTLRIESGPSARWEELRVHVRGGVDGPAIRPPEGAFVRSRLESELVGWIEEWGESGYPFAVAEVESLTVRSGQIRVGIRLDPGPKVQVSELAISGLRGTRQSFLERWLSFHAEETYRESDLMRRQRRLERTGLFSWVGEPRIEPLGPEAVRIHYAVEEGAHNRIEGALGYAGTSGQVSGRVDVEMGNLFGTGRVAALRWERLGDDDSRLDLRYEEPMLLGTPIGASVEVFQQVQDTTFTLDRFEGRVFSDLGTDLTVSLGFELRRSVLGGAPSDVIRRGSTVFGLEWETLRPGRLTGRRVEGSFRTGRSRYEFADGTRRSERLDRVEFASESYWRRGTLAVLRTVLRAGGLSGAKDRDLPASEALWIGGATGPRGWDEESFATRRYVSGQFEAGVALAADRGRVYGFVDGAAYRSLATGSDERAGGWGLGLANESVRRSVVVDYGIPFGEGFSQGRVHLRVRTRF